ncbi:hypothetical protein [Thermomonospora amylolytica]|uniref:hypothetical protein n=1 Tax=Thermomonospora amylolytica TaxID=1411117 RepID=UPI000E6C9CA7|nr:hypothetical protein [Thermomonospora amylolytica]
MTATALSASPPAAPRSTRALRRAVCFTTIAACAPYLALKIAWLCGSTVGWKVPADAEGSALYVANAITLGLDAVAVVVASAFTYRWGLRLPAWLVLPPIWIGTGLLVPIALAAPIALSIEAASGPAATDTGSSLYGWVYLMVYGGFTLQAVGLTAAFVFYARERWSEVFRIRTAELPTGPTRPLQTALAGTGTVLAAVYAAAQLYWAFGGTLGQDGERTGPSMAVSAVWAVLALAGAAGLLTMVHRLGGGPLWRPLGIAWVGAGSLFAQSLYLLLVAIGRPGGMGEEATAASAYVFLAGVLGGLLLGVTGVMRLAERAAPNGPARRSQSASPTASSAP